MAILVTGSLAYDTIMGYHGVFIDQFRNITDHLSAAFLIDSKVREFGGCGGNIAYNLGLLGEDVDLVGRAGRDFSDYEEWLVENSINTDHINMHEGIDTAIAYITSDAVGNQITSFYPGVMDLKQTFKPPKSRRYNLAIIAPEDVRWMSQVITYCTHTNTPFLFDPGQQIDALSKKDLMIGIKGAQIVIVNGSEFEFLQRKTNLSPQELIDMVPTFIVTHGSKGSVIYSYGNILKIGIAKPCDVVDPTGAGDAYRAGIATGITCGFDMELTGQIAATIASFAVEEFGTQNHYFELEEFNARLQKNFGKELHFEE